MYASHYYVNLFKNKVKVLRRFKMEDNISLI